MNQPHLQGQWSTPQGNRPDELSLGVFETEVQALRVCEANAPPRWMGPGEKDSCTLCNLPFTMLRRSHHCRNCGAYVCSKCSSKDWPSSQLPPTYHDREKKVRVCQSCEFLASSFREALQRGDVALAMSTYNSNNVNIYTPYANYGGDYAVHLAAAGGSMYLLQWLVEDRLCSVKEARSDQMLRTTDGLTVLDMAAMRGHVEVMRYLCSTCECDISEMRNLTVVQRGLHAALASSGPTPRVVFPNETRNRRSTTRFTREVIEDDDGASVAADSEWGGGPAAAAAAAAAAALDEDAATAEDGEEAPLSPEEEERRQLKEEAAALEAEVKRMRIQASDEEDQLRQMGKGGLMRLVAEVDNYKRRRKADVESAVRRADQKVVAQFLPLLDMFDELQARRGEVSTERLDKLHGNYQGLGKQLKTALDKKGLEPMTARPGERVDYTKHEVVQWLEGEAEGTVVDVKAPGWSVGGAPVRKAQVV
eukprot:CAMPEP_0198425314 /NCGR_PEP_ID=MMETSP1452-20131203/4481_1 /TAXON_ID=1181717 /ORGANISM="Synchroma pusillum, Strain CCMP3072" /LENGTH=477 /DNA_ID=CAMNT_0044145669 /DNA_START=25 /DNA_END=1454 /DNA_ORIENTATION=-